MSRCDAIRSLVDAAEPGELPAIAGELARGYAMVLSRIATPVTTNAPSVAPAAGELLSVGQAAARLGVPASWLYRHHKSLPFARKLGHRTLRFDPDGLERWTRGRAAHIARAQ